MLSRLVITFLPRSKRLLISWLQSPSAVTLEQPKIKSDTVSTVSPSISHEVIRPDAMILVVWILSFKPTFSISSFTFIKRPFFGIGMKTDLFQSCGHWWVFQIFWHIECSTFTASSFRIWNSSAGILMISLWNWNPPWPVSRKKQFLGKSSETGRENTLKINK